MTDPDATKRLAFFLERRHIEALLDPENCATSVVSEARDHLRAVLDGAKLGIHTDDPREAGGTMVDVSGDPHARDAVLFDTRRAILPEEMEFAIANGTSDGEPMPEAVAMLIRGRINRPPDHQATREAPAEKVEHLHLLPWDTAADIIVDIHALAGRNGTTDELVALLESKWADLEKAGVTKQQRGEP
jgi:hypothetical protein